MVLIFISSALSYNILVPSVFGDFNLDNEGFLPGNRVTEEYEAVRGTLFDSLGVFSRGTT